MQEVQYNTVGHSTKGDSFFHGLQISMQSRHCMPRQRIEYGTTWYNTTGLSTMQSYCSWSLKACVSPCTSNTARQGESEDSIRYNGVQYNRPQQATAVVLSGLAPLHVLETLQDKANQRIQFDTKGYTATHHSRQLFFQGLDISVMYSDTAKQGRRFKRIQRDSVQHTTVGSCSSRAWTSQSCTSDTARKGRRFSRIQHNKYNAMWIAQLIVSQDVPWRKAGETDKRLIKVKHNISNHESSFIWVRYELITNTSRKLATWLRRSRKKSFAWGYKLVPQQQQ